VTEELAKYNSMLPDLISNFGQPAPDEVFSIGGNMEGVIPKIPDVKMSKDGIFFFPGDIAVPAFKGVILFHRGSRAYWENPNATGSRPDCKSDNGYWASPEDASRCPIPPQARRQNEKKYGHAMYCDTCPMNQWGSDPKGGRGKACKEGHIYFVLVIEGDMTSAVPYRLQTPPTSQAQKDAFFTDLTGKAIPYQTVVTEFSLEKVGNNPQQVFSKLVLRAGTKQLLPREDQLKLKALIEKYSAGFAQQEDYSHVQDDRPARPEPPATPTPKDEDIPF
jgi:hypothetical protein